MRPLSPLPSAATLPSSEALQGLRTKEQSPPAGSAATTQGPAGARKAPEPSAEMLKAAREFEAVFLRTMLGSLEKTTKMGGGSSMTAGQSTYGSMVVGAMSEAMSNAGGIGLAGVVAQALSTQAARAEPKPK